jgi:hypothetical protein
MSRAEAITRAYGGEWHGSYGTIPTPGHSAKDRGTTVRDADDGDVLFNSFNGADWRDLKDECRRRGLLDDKSHNGADRREPTRWLYHDAAGEVLRAKVRPGPRGEKYGWQHPVGNGWKWGKGKSADVPYRLPGLLASKGLIVMVEGEKHADKLAGWGFTATSLKDWRADFAQYIAGHPILILPDNDATGADLAAKAKAHAERAGCTVHVIELPGLARGGDVMDWTGTSDELRKLIEAATAPALPAYKRGISAAALMDKHFEPVNYVIPGLLAEGAWLFGGKPKIGKSWMAYDLALAIASGRPVFDSIPITQGDVLYLALEDSQRRLKSRLLKKGVRNPPERLTLVEQGGWPDLDNGCIAELEAWADAVARPTLIIVDVLKMVRGATRANESLYDADYRALTGLAAFARLRGIAVLIVHHVRKMDSDDPLESLSGTNGLTGAADGVMVLKRDSGTGHCLLYVRGRDVEESEKAVRFKPDNGTWELLGNAQDVGRTDERHAILETLRSHDNPLSVREISDILGKNYEAVRKCLARMWANGEIEKKGRGSYTCPVCPDVPIDPEPDNRTHRTGYSERDTALDRDCPF